MLNDIKPRTDVFIDANIFLYEILDHWRYGRSCRTFLENVNEGKYSGLISVLICNEVFHRVVIGEVVEKYEINPKSAVGFLKNNWEIMKELNKAQDAIANIKQIDNLRIVEINRDVFDLALNYSTSYGLLSNDAIHLAVLKKSGITNIATNDKDFKRIEWLKVWNP